MKKRIGLLIMIIVAALIIGLLVWRFLPQSFSDLISVDGDAVTSFSAYAMVSRFENGQSDTDTYRIDNPEQKSNAPGEIIEILTASGYRQDFRNLLPWGIDSAGSDKNYDGRTVNLNFYFENAKNESIDITFLSSSIIVLRTEEHPGMRIYHPTNRKTIDKLVEYLQTHGVKQ